MKIHSLILIKLTLLLSSILGLISVPRALASFECNPVDSLVNVSGDYSTSSPKCHLFEVPSHTNLIQIFLKSLSGGFDLYYGEGRINFFSLWDKQNKFGTIENETKIVFQQPQAGLHTVGVDPDRSGRYRLEISTASATTGEVSSSQQCSGNICRQVYKLEIARAAIELGSKFGDRVIFPIELSKPGRIEVRVNWEGTARKLAVILNGPDRPEQSNPVAYYARRDDISPITLSYNVTSSDFNRGRKWFVSLVNFSGGQARNGEVAISYPREASPNFVNTRASLNDFIGNWQNVDRNTRGITRLAIRRRGNSLGIHSWGSCHPTDCDHGETTVAFQGNPLIVSREVSFKKEIRTITMLDNGELRVLSDNIFTDGTRRDYVKEYRLRKVSTSMTSLSAPRLISPVDRTVFNHYPRNTTLRWSPVRGAVSYTVEIDCYDCCQFNQWCSDVGGQTRIEPNINSTNYSFKFVGAQPGRWRVWAVDAVGRKSPKSSWYKFRYTR